MRRYPYVYSTIEIPSFTRDNNNIYNFLNSFISVYFGLFDVSDSNFWSSLFCSSLSIIVCTSLASSLVSASQFPIFSNTSSCPAISALVFLFLLCSKFGTTLTWPNYLHVLVSHTFFIIASLHKEEILMWCFSLKMSQIFLVFMSICKFNLTLRFFCLLSDLIPSYFKIITIFQ
jgi:hypothetical protein